MPPGERQWIRVVGIAVAFYYVAAVGGFALCKATATFGMGRMSWAEVAFGPAITVISTFLIFLAVTGFEHLVKRVRRGRR